MTEDTTRRGQYWDTQAQRWVTTTSTPEPDTGTTEPTEEEETEEATDPDAGTQAEEPLLVYRRTYDRLLAQGKAQEAGVVLAQAEERAAWLLEAEARGETDRDHWVPGPATWPRSVGDFDTEGNIVPA